ncbi:transposase [Candidatus Poriferisodalis sp.]|uniref:transposase n=1 Tax=Candidatus Poriferisodalis sp. TaxID=3101277 RepID=UPI003B01D333
MAKNAPGKHYRKGLTLTALFEMFPDDKTAEAWFAAKRWGGDITCPRCGHDDVQTGAAHKTMPYRCRGKDCRKRFSVKTGTEQQMATVAAGMDGKRLTYADLTADVVGAVAEADRSEPW